MESDATVIFDIEEQGEPDKRTPKEKTVMVSARVPASLCNRVKDILRELGSSQTELVNAAFEYVLDRRELPESHVASGLHRRSVTAEELESFREHMREITGSRTRDAAYEDLPDDEVLTLALMEKYSALSGDDE